MSEATPSLTELQSSVAILKDELALAVASTAEDRIDQIKVISSKIKSAEKSIGNQIEAIEKRLEEERRSALEKIGCKPDNHPKSWTAEQHLALKAQMYKENQAVLDQFRPKA